MEVDHEDDCRGRKDHATSNSLTAITNIGPLLSKSSAHDKLGPHFLSTSLAIAVTRKAAQIMAIRALRVSIAN